MRAVAYELSAIVEGGEPGHKVVDGQVAVFEVAYYRSDGGRIDPTFARGFMCATLP